MEKMQVCISKYNGKTSVLFNVIFIVNYLYKFIFIRCRKAVIYEPANFGARMKIAIDIRNLVNNNSKDHGYFLSEVLKRISDISPGEEFFLIADRKYEPRFPVGENVHVITAGPVASSPLLLKLWYEIRLPRLLKKIHADLLVTGTGICSLSTDIPQCMIIDDLSFLCYPSYNRAEHFFLKRHMKKYVQKAAVVIALSDFLSDELVMRYAVEREKIFVVPGAAHNFPLLTEIEKDEVRLRYTGGKNYFLFTGEIDQRQNIINLLKAFSVFKKRQKSDWKLVIAGRISPRFKSFKENIRSYKYRDELVVLDALFGGESAKMTAAAWATVYPANCMGSVYDVFDSWHQGVPVITAANSEIAGLAKDAVMVFDPADHKDIADKMMYLYKDEALRSKLADQGKAALEAYSWDKSASLFWEAIMQTRNRDILLSR